MALESGSHWYNGEGQPCHLVPNKTKGGLRPTTIKDARSLGLYPSVTTVLKLLAAPQLSKWRERQVALAALTYPRTDKDVLDDKFLDKIREDAFKEVEVAAEHGTKVHDALEKYFSDEPYDPEYKIYVDAVDNIFRSENIHVVQRELNLVNREEGYAGKADLIIDCPKGMGVGDYKNRKSKPGYPMDPYDGQATQIAAYDQAHYGEINQKCGFNLFISSTEPGRVEISWYDDLTLRAEWELFQHLCAIWRIRSNYDPRLHGQAA